MSERTLYLGWQDRGRTSAWFPVGRLDVDLAAPHYRFRHVKGAERARATGGFEVVPGFSDLHGDYASSQLFPVFQNRLMSPKRPDFREYITRLDLEPSAHFTDILAVDGGRRMTDHYEVFPRLFKNDDGSFICRFFLHGLHHTNNHSLGRIADLVPEERLHVAVELTNPTGYPAVQIQTTPDYYLIGWAPRYFVHDLMMAMAESDGNYEARVVRVNLPPYPSEQRVLIEMRSRWERHEPMSGPEFEPLVG